MRPLIAVALLGLVACSSEPAPDAIAARPVTLATVQAGSDATPPLLGSVRAERRAELSFQVGGRVAEIRAEPGQAIQRGDVLARIDLTALTTQLRQAEAQTREARAAAEDATLRRARLKGLVEGGAAAPAEWDAAVAAVEASTATLQGAIAARDALAWQLAQGELRAPFNGVIAARLIEPGQSVGPGIAAIAIDGGGRELRVPVPATQAATLRVGNTALAFDGATQRRARISHIGERRLEGGLVEVQLSLLEGGAPGQIMPVRFASAGDSALWVPARAVIPSPTPGEGHVMRYEPGLGQALRIDVRYGKPKGDLLQVTDGLQSGDQIVARGAGFVSDGMSVTPVATAR